MEENKERKVVHEPPRQDDVNKDKWKGTITTQPSDEQKKRVEEVLKNIRNTSATTGTRG